MTIYIALLRGINVGRNMLKMEQLRKILAEAGFSDAKTYLQSGNVVFRAQGSAPKVAGLIEQQVSALTRLPVTVLLRTSAQLQRVVAGNPFTKEAAALSKTVHVTFLAGTAPKSGLAAIGKIEAAADRWQAAGSQVYLHCPNGYGRSKLVNSALERALGMRATTRNWATVTALLGMAAE
jgi:uncharacterized protein (DUF1697 family)